VQEQLGQLTLRRNADLSRFAPAQLQSSFIGDVFQPNSGQCDASRAMHAMTEAGMRIAARRGHALLAPAVVTLNGNTSL
jgi:hypothetical protein